MRVAMKRPISESPLAEMVPTWAISSFSVTVFEFFWRSQPGRIVDRDKFQCHPARDF